MNEIVSVIVPIYKVEEYLERCVDSILKQTYQNIEIILVDDGSPDKCGLICDEYSFKDHRIKVLHKVNGGLSDARNAGIDVASGQYITFIDSDDYVADNYVEELIRAIQGTQSDMSMVAAQVVSESSPCLLNGNKGNITCISSNEAIIRSLHLSLRQSAWGKLYKTEVFSDIRFPKGMLYEDLAITYQVFDKIEKMAISDAKLYKYVIRPGSIMQSSFNILHYNSLIVADQAMDFVIEKYPNLYYQAEGRRVYSYFTVLRRMLLDGDSEKHKAQIEELKYKITTHSKNLLFNKRIKASLKLRILSYRMSDKLYLVVENAIYNRIESNYDL